MAGYTCDVSAISKFCDEKKIILIEDCAHALGTYNKKKNTLEILDQLGVFLFILQNKSPLVKVEW